MNSRRYIAVISIIIILIAVVVVIFTVTKTSTSETPTAATEPTPATIQTPTTQSLCYYFKQKNASGFNDIAWLKLNLSGNDVTGEFRNLPAEKDSKIGTFTGTVSDVTATNSVANPSASTANSKPYRLANVWWNSTAEGMNMTEELHIKFTNDEATALFGEMIDRGDGTYVYKNPDALTEGNTMLQVPCDFIDTKVLVENDVRDTINSIITVQPTSGSTWSASSVEVDPTSRTGIVSYGDGHMQAQASFAFTVTADNKVSITHVKKLNQ